MTAEEKIAIERAIALGESNQLLLNEIRVAIKGNELGAKGWLQSQEEDEAFRLTASKQLSELCTKVENLSTEVQKVNALGEEFKDFKRIFVTLTSKPARYVYVAVLATIVLTWIAAKNGWEAAINWIKH